MTTFAARTDVGRRGGENEDSIGWDAAGRLWFVADGMGGHAAGAVASRIVKETLLELSGRLSPEDAVIKAHEAVIARGQANASQRGMGATLVSAWLDGDNCHIVWVGDSRAYLWRKKTLQPLTRDHSFLEELRRVHNLSDEQLHNHPERHLVTQTLGVGTPVPSRIDVKLRQGDWVLLCSDGLTDELTDAELGPVLMNTETVEDGADALIRAALDKGGRDNVSVVLVAYDKADAGRSRLSSSTARAVLAAAGIVAALASAAAWWYVYGK